MGRSGMRYDPRDEQMEGEVCRIARHWLNQGSKPEENPILELGQGKNQIVVMNLSTYELLKSRWHSRKPIQNRRK